MRKAILLGVVAVVFSIAAAPAWADMDAKDVAKAVKLKSENKPFFENLGKYPESQGASFSSVGGTYVIDISAQLCYLLGSQARTLVPCKNLKKGYPLIAPLITWDD